MRQNPIGNIFQALLGGYQQYNQGRVQNWQMQQQQAQQQLEQRRYDAQDARQQQQDARAEQMRNMQLALGLVAPKDRARVAQGYGITLPEGVQPYDPEAERRQQLHEQANQMMGQGLQREAFTRQDPGRILPLVGRLLEGQDIPNAPGFQYRPAGGGAVPQTVGGFPTQIAPENGISAAFRNNPDLTQVAQGQREAAASQKADADRASRERIAQQRAQATLQAAGLRIDAQNLATASRFFLDNWDATGNPLIAEQNLRGFLDRHQGGGADGAPGAFAGAVQTPQMRAAAAQEQRLQDARTNAERVGEDRDLDRALRAKLGVGGLDMRRQGLDLQREGVDLRRDLGNRGLDLRSRGLDIQQQRANSAGGGKGGPVRMDAADTQEAAMLRGRIGRLESAIQFDTPAAQKKDKDAIARVNRNTVGLNNSNTRLNEILGKYRKPATGDPETDGLLNDLGLGGQAPAMTGVQRRPAAAATSGGYSPALKAARQRHFAEFQRSRGHAPNPAEMNLISQMVEDGRLK